MLDLLDLLARIFLAGLLLMLLVYVLKLFYLMGVGRINNNVMRKS